MKKKFSWRSFISFALLYYFLIIFVSGSILYIAPPGRIANWTDWQLLGLNKARWQTMHTNFSYLFAILSIFHLFTINWKTFLSYIKSKARSGLNKKRELYLSSLLTVLVFLGVIYLIPPFSTVMDIGEGLKEGWEKQYDAPPVPHAEEYSIAQLSADILKIPEQSILKKLEGLGIVVENNEQTLKELAPQVELSPNDIYTEIGKGTRAAGAGGRIAPGGGLGRKTMEQISAENGILLDEILSLLAAEGIEAEAGDVMKDLADRYNRAPSEILSILNGGSDPH